MAPKIRDGNVMCILDSNYDSYIRLPHGIVAKSH